MKKEQKEIIKQAIIKEIEKTKITIEENKDLIQPIEPDCAIGRVSRMDAMVNQNVARMALRKAEEKFRNLEIAQKNIDNDGFRICAKCGKDIPIGRILLVPQSKYCVNCAK
ncbi:MAG: TraR/DksA C4-type zinc finger protein [Bacteroidales bacterium]|nr:TraR/DksA C4-type zinc finger protein [Bacteroidales bacterium]